MKVVLLYLRVIRKCDVDHPEHKSYEESTRRFIETYKRFKPTIPHRLVVANCGDRQSDTLFDELVDDYTYYNGGGYDCGTYQALGSHMDCDLVFGLNTHTYFWRKGWLEPFVDAATTYGPGVYGATASYQCNPHLRTPAIAFHPSIMRAYPEVVNCRSKTCLFEAGPNNFALFALANGVPAKLVAANGVYDLPEWRKPDNIFRRGDQTNCLVWDRHTDIYAHATETEKRALERDADVRT